MTREHANVCVCVCVREIEREREHSAHSNVKRDAVSGDLEKGFEDSRLRSQQRMSKTAKHAEILDLNLISGSTYL